MYPYSDIFHQKAKSRTNGCVAHGWTCVYEKKNRGGGARGTRGNHRQRAPPTTEPKTPNSTTFTPKVSGAPKPWSLLSLSPRFNTANSGESIPYEGDAPRASYTSLQDKEKGQDGKAILISTDSAALWDVSTNLMPLQRT
jgi:hypothetical protein